MVNKGRECLAPPRKNLISPPTSAESLQPRLKGRTIAITIVLVERQAFGDKVSSEYKSAFSAESEGLRRITQFAESLRMNESKYF